MTDASAPSGIFAAVLTPMNAELDVDRAAFIRHCHWLLANGCDGLAPLGTTGEANSLSVDERLSILDAIEEAGIPGAKLIPGVGSTAIPDAVRLTRRALAMKAGGVLALPPFYYKGVSEDGLFAAFAEIVERVGDSALKLYLYNFPQQVGFPLTQSLVARLVKAYPDTIVGMKDSSGDWSNMETTLKNLPGFRLFPGSEEFLLAGARLGAVGTISATVNVTSALAQEVWRHWRDSDADRRQARLTAARKAFAGLPPVSALKGYLARESGRREWNHQRPPHMPLARDAIEGLARKLEEAGFALAKAA